ncbi:MAG: hypothetical protein KDA75_08240, partial [Planctomycetaceae bacterium]|nr:hypothetical protein [Planctomycetaceae bacterium]
EGTDETRVELAFRLVLARSPRPEEQEIILKTLAAARERFTTAPEAAQKLIEEGDSAVPEGVDPIELAAHTILSRVLLNLDETVTRE